MKPRLWMDKSLAWIRRHQSRLVNTSVLAGVYFVFAKFGLSLAHTTRQITAVWPASGLALVVVLVLGYSYWPAITIGAFAANWSDRETLLVALAIAIGNSLEALVGAWMVRRLGQGGNRMETPQAAGAIAAGAILGSLVAASVGSTSLALGGVIAWHNWIPNWLTWWGGDTLGMLLFGSILLVLLDRSVYGQVKTRPMEGGLLLATVFAATVVIFTAHPTTFSGLHFYLLFPFMVWAALRFTRLGVASVTLLISAVGVWAAVSGVGPLAIPQIDQALVQFLLFVLVITATSLMLAMAIEARQAAVTALQTQARHLEALEAQLKDANRRVTDILAGVLRTGEPDDDRPGSNAGWSS